MGVRSPHCPPPHALSPIRPAPRALPPQRLPCRKGAKDAAFDLECPVGFSSPSSATALTPRGCRIPRPIAVTVWTRTASSSSIPCRRHLFIGRTCRRHGSLLSSPAFMRDIHISRELYQAVERGDLPKEFLEEIQAEHLLARCPCCRAEAEAYASRRSAGFFAGAASCT